MTVLPFKKPALAKPEWQPNARNGEVYATPCTLVCFAGDVEIETDDGFAVVHMSRSGDSASMERGYASMEAALIGALQMAKRLNAVFLSDQGGQH